MSEATFTATSEAGTTTTSVLPAKPDCQRGKSEQVRPVRPTMSELWERSQIQSILPAYSESRFSATSEAISIATSLLPAKPDPLLPAKPVLPLPVKPDTPLPPCSQQSQIVTEVRVIILLQPACSKQSQIQSFLPAYSESRFSATSMLQSCPDPLQPAKPVSLLPALPDPPLPACPHRSQIHCYQWSQFHHNQLAPSKPDPLLSLCSQQSQSVREVRVNIRQLPAGC